MSEKNGKGEKIKAYLTDIKEFKPDPANANRHTLRGRAMVEKGMEQRGYARPAFAASDGTVLGGNLSTMEVAPGIGLGDGKVFVIESDGTIPIIHKRVDVEAGSAEARLLAIEDNRTGETGLEWNPEQLVAEMESGLDLSGLFNQGEIEEIYESALLAQEIADSLLDSPVSNDRKLGDPQRQIKPVLYVDELATFENAIKAAGDKNRGRALIKICEYYLQNATGQLDL